MPATVALTIPVKVASRAQHDALRAIFGGALGASDIVIDDLGEKAMLRFHFPGDIDPVMHELYLRGLSSTATMAVWVGIDRNSAANADWPEILGRIEALPAVSNVSFDGVGISATVAAATEALRGLHAEVERSGLVL